MRDSTENYRFVSQEKLREHIPNIYEAVMVSAREARRINVNLKMLGTEDDRSVKVTSIAIDRLLNKEINFDYKESQDSKKK